MEPVKNDTELVEKIRGGSADDFGELIQEHQGLVYSILYRYERDKHLLEDLAQETFIKAWKALHQFDGRAPFSHWLSRIAVHVALDHLRKRKRVQKETAIEDLGEDALEWFHGEENTDLQGNQAREILELAMQKLSAEERLVITLQEIEGKNAAEIGALTGWSNVGVRVRVFRARKKLRAALLAMENRKTKKQNPES